MLCIVKDVFFFFLRLSRSFYLTLSLSFSFSNAASSFSSVLPTVRTMINKTRRVRNCFETFVPVLRRLRTKEYFRKYTFIMNIPRVKKKKRCRRGRRWRQRIRVISHIYSLAFCLSLSRFLLLLCQ